MSDKTRTGFIRYEHLTWPEVGELPRDIPLVIPLGEGYSLERLASALGTPARIGLLPAIPYGWSGSGLPLPPPVFSEVLANLLQCLREDGFVKVFVLIPAGAAVGLSVDTIALPSVNISPAELIPTDVDRHKVVLIPIGHTEQHGYHLPLCVDTVLIEAIGTGVTQLIPDQAVCLPVMPYGVSTHRASFPGTLNVGGRAFEDLFLAVIDVLAGRGFEKIYLMSGHGGNVSFLVNVVKYAGERYPQLFCATSWLYLSGVEGIAALEKNRQSQIGGMGHACELETSLFLYLKPELSHMERVKDEMDFIATPSYYMDWVEGGALIANPPWEDDTASGSYGAGSLGTAEKGRIWLEAAIAEKAAHVAEIHEQYLRRKERRLRRLLNRSQNE